MESKKLPFVSILIVSWNIREQLQICLEGLYRQIGIELEIIVIDNNSFDGSPDMVRTTFPRTHCLKNTTNRGFAYANNQGLRIAKGDYVMLINPDVEFLESNTITRVVEAHKRTGAGIVGPRILNADRTVQQSVRKDPDSISQALIISKIHVLMPNASVLRKYYCYDFNYDKEQQVEQISGAFFSISRNVIQDIGLLDEGFWIWFEEVDFCTRARMNDHAIWYTPNTTVVHHGGQSFQKMLPRARHFQYTQSLIRYAKKYFSFSTTLLIRCASIIGRLLSFLTPPNLRLKAYTKR